MAQLLIDEEALLRASNEFKELEKKTRQLCRDLVQLNIELSEGFKTPAGEKFRLSYQQGLLFPLNEQITVIMHISENLNNARNSYQSVFDEYREIVNDISSDE